MFDTDQRDEIDVGAMDEAVARLQRGELREGLLWLGRAHRLLDPALALYDADRRSVDLVVSGAGWNAEIAA